MKNLIYLIFVMLVTITIITAQQKDFPKLTGPYLGQKPPGRTPEIFAPGIISIKNHRDYGCTFSPDGKWFFYTRGTIGKNKQSIMFCKLEESGWTAPIYAFNSWKYSQGEPNFSPNGNQLLFARLKKMENGEWIPFIHISEKCGSSWKEPYELMEGLFITMAANKTLYFTYVLNGMDSADIVRSRYQEGEYGEPEFLSMVINTKYNEFHPFIAPDEGLLIFDSNRPGGYGKYDIYISFRKNDGTWCKPINLGAEINTAGYEGVASLSPDGRFLFFNRNEDIYWVDAKIIEELKPRELK
jgi:hypothetical protein